MIEGRRWPLWAKLVFVALPAAVSAAAAVSASITLTATPTGSLAQADAILGAFYDAARTAARSAVLIGAPAAVLALVGLLIIGGYKHYPAEEGSAEHLPTLLGRVVMGCALFAGVGLLCQMMLAAQLGGWSPL